MKRSEKIKKKTRVKNRVFLTLAIYAGATLALLWLLLSVFLSDIYGAFTRTRAKAAAARMVSQIKEQSSFASEVEYEAAVDDMCAIVYKVTDSGMEIAANHETTPDCAVHRLTPFGQYMLYSVAEQAGGTYVETITPDKAANDPKNDLMGRLHLPNSIIIVRTAVGQDGAKYALFLSCELEPVTAAVKTINLVLALITGVMIAAAMVFAVIMSRRISRPLAGITADAGQLAKGDYSVTFDESSDIAEISELASALNYAVGQLSQVDNLKTELVANVSHDLRTPLTLIAGYGEVMRDVPGENTPENAQIIVNEVSRLSMIVNDVLDLSKLESGADKPDFKPFSLTDCISDIAASYRRMLDKPGYVIRFEPAENVWINGDRVKISRLLYNLINNAVDYTGEDKTVTLTQQTEGEKVTVTVADTGSGIPESELPHIFDRYFKGKGQNLRRRGSGLGLAIVKAVALMHGARFGVRTSGKGSEFWVEFAVVSSPTDELNKNS